MSNHGDRPISEFQLREMEEDADRRENAPVDTVDELVEINRVLMEIRDQIIGPYRDVDNSTILTSAVASLSQTCSNIQSHVSVINTRLLTANFSNAIIIALLAIGLWRFW